jgi:hypothetical protein
VVKGNRDKEVFLRKTAKKIAEFDNSLCTTKDGTVTGASTSTGTGGKRGGAWRHRKS